VTRTPMAFVFPLFFFEAMRASGWDWRKALHPALIFAAPVAAIAIAAVIYNLIRFAGPAEFGHSFLHVRQQDQVETFGLFSAHYLSRNLAVIGALLPSLDSHTWIKFPGHGLALWLTCPALLLCLWPARSSWFARAVAVTLGLVAIPALFYQNTGWVQFGYRFCLDWLPLAIVLLACNGRRLGWAARALILWGVAINIVGVITFDRWSWRYYRIDDASYKTIIAN
jgi:hypothetical protein